MPAVLFLMLLLLISTSENVTSQISNSSHLISPHTFNPNHHKMLLNFKIYIYPYHHQTPTFKDPTESAFYSTLLTSTFLTSDPDEAHLFFIPFAPSSRLIRDIRSTYPYWNRTLGADHFYLHCPGIGYQSDRNLVELKKNAVQISCFPTTFGHFIPHKDITLPPLNHSTSKSPSSNLKLLSGSDDKYKYCKMSYADGSVGMIGEALLEGCVPVVMVDSGGTAQDLPMMGVVRWAEMAVFVAVEGGGGVSDGETVRRVLREVESGGGYERMREMGVAAARHFAWGKGGLVEQYDAFHSVMYQLWVRRHTIRYARVDVSSS